VLNIGILYRTNDFLSFINNININEEEFHKSFQIFKSIKSIYIIDVSIKCKWIYTNSEGYMKPSDKGKKILDNKNDVLRLRLQIKDILKYYIPPWLTLIKRGRKELARNMTPNEKQCFINANLLEESDFDTIKWWDEFIISAYEQEEQKNLKVGRYGEFLSLIYEEIRTGQKPKLISLDVNYAGYDILSQISKDDKTPLYIEVKCSKSPWNKAKFYLTRNEWEVFSMNQNSRIQLWSVNQEINFNTINRDQLQINIPFDSGKGKWENVQIPFNLVDSLKNPFNNNPLWIKKSKYLNLIDIYV